MSKDNSMGQEGLPDRDDKAISSRYEELKRQGYAPKRALYIAHGSPYGTNRKSMKRWHMDQKHLSGNSSD